MSLSTSKLNWRESVAGKGDRNASAELYTASADWNGAPILDVCNDAGVHLYAGLDVFGATRRHRASSLKVFTGRDNVVTNGDFETSPLAGWTASSAGFAISRQTSRIIAGTATGKLHKDKTNQLGSKLDLAFSVLSGDATVGKSLCATLEYATGPNYVDKSIEVRIIKGTSTVVASKAIPIGSGALRLDWESDGTLDYVWRFIVVSDLDTNAATDVTKDVYVDNLYAGPGVIHSVARKPIIMLNDSSDNETFDRVKSWDETGSFSTDLEPFTSYTLMDVTRDFDGFMLESGSYNPTLFNVEIHPTLPTFNSAYLDRGVTIDGVDQGSATGPDGTYRFRLDGSHRVKYAVYYHGVFKSSMSLDWKLFRKVPNQ